jgi:hypothetical protein
MKKTIIGLTLATMILAVGSFAEAQQAKLAKIGELTFGRRSGMGTGRELLRQELRALGYTQRAISRFSERRRGNWESQAGSC